jgi:uncharacterized GH25 family protein
MLTIKVLDRRSGKPLENARVSLFYGMLGNHSHRGQTDHQGEVHLEAKPGKYGITVNAPHFSDDVELNPGRNVIYV